MNAPDIFHYDDYRKFLKDLYDLQKRTFKKYSYRQFASDLGFQFSNYLHLVISSKRNLSASAIETCLKFFKWPAQKKRYFKCLVLMNQAKTPSGKSSYQAELDHILKQQRTLIGFDKYSLFSAWYIPVIKEMFAFKKFVPNLNWISRKLQPPVSEQEIRQAIFVLERLKIIEREKGGWQLKKEHVTTDAEVTSEIVHRYHQEMLKLSQNSLKLPARERDVSSMTMSLSEAQFERIKQKIIEFRDEIQQEIQETTEEATLVAQMNIQLFQATK